MAGTWRSASTATLAQTKHAISRVLHFRSPSMIGAADAWSQVDTSIEALACPAIWRLRVRGLLLSENMGTEARRLPRHRADDDRRHIPQNIVLRADPFRRDIHPLLRREDVSLHAIDRSRLIFGLDNSVVQAAGQGYITTRNPARIVLLRYSPTGIRQRTHCIPPNGPIPGVC